jgi:hypothetical protein
MAFARSFKHSALAWAWLLGLTSVMSIYPTLTNAGGGGGGGGGKDKGVIVAPTDCSEGAAQDCVELSIKINNDCKDSAGKPALGYYIKNTSGKMQINVNLTRSVQPIVPPGPRTAVLPSVGVTLSAGQSNSLKCKVYSTLDDLLYENYYGYDSACFVGQCGNAQPSPKPEIPTEKRMCLQKCQAGSADCNKVSLGFSPAAMRQEFERLVRSAVNLARPQQIDMLATRKFIETGMRQICGLDKIRLLDGQILFDGSQCQIGLSFKPGGGKLVKYLKYYFVANARGTTKFITSGQPVLVAEFGDVLFTPFVDFFETAEDMSKGQAKFRETVGSMSFVTGLGLVMEGTGGSCSLLEWPG